MAKRAFNLGEELRRSGVPTVDTREQIEYIELDHIDPDPENFYSLDGIDELAGSIELVGLQQPLRVRDGEYGHVIVVSGHRRRAACMLIRDGGSDMFKDGVPCIRERPAALPEMQELRLIFGNAQTRVLSAPELSRQAVKTRDLIAKLRSKGFEFQGRTRELVATVLQTSDSRIGRLTAIREKLVPELRVEFDAGRLGETVAYRISQEAATVQADLAAKLGPAVNNLSVDSAEKVIDQVKKALAAKDREPDVGKSIDTLKKYIDASNKEDDDFFEMLNDVAKEFIRTLGAVNSRSEGIETLKSEFGRTCFGHSSRGDGASFTSTPKGLTLYRRDVPKIFRTWTEVYDMLCTIALNRAATGSGWEDDVDPAPVSKMDTAPDWQTGAPPKTGYYAARLEFFGKPLASPRVIWWDEGAWYNAVGDDIRQHKLDSQISVVGWWPLPEEPC